MDGGVDGGGGCASVKCRNRHIDKNRSRGIRLAMGA